MNIKAYWTKWHIALLAFAFLAACGGSGDKKTFPISAVSEGTLSNPVNVGIVESSKTHAGSIGTNGVSYYRFTTGSANGAYTIGLTNTKSDLGWTLFNSSHVEIDWCDEYDAIGPHDEVCQTPSLTANSVYYLYVNEWDGTAGTFTLTLSPPVTPATPTANAGANQNVKTGSKVTLDGTASYDPNGDSLTYAWSFTQKPNGSTAALSGSVASKPTFTADMDGVFRISLVVSDGVHTSLPDTVDITAATFNSTPVANAGSNQYIITSNLVTLDGSASSDADGDSLTYSWAFTVKPDGSAASLSDSRSAGPTFTPDKDGVYTLSLVVNDGYVDSLSATTTVKAYKNISKLNFRIIDAEYSKQLDKIVAVSSQPSNQLHIYDAITNADTTVNLNLAPTSVSVSPDGLYAAVGHNAYISYVNLSTATLVKTLSVTADVFDVVLAGNGYAYVFPRIDQWETIRCINISNGNETQSSGYSIYAGTKGKLHPGGTSIYGADNGLSPSDIEKYDISGGTAALLYDSPYHGDYYMCGDLWMAEDGLRIFTRCGNVFRASANRYSTGYTPEDMTYNGSLENLTLVKHLSHSAAIGKVLAIPENNYSDANADTKIMTFNYDYLTFDSSVTAPYFVVNTTSAFAGHGRYAFYKSDGTKSFVILQADSTSGMLYDYGIVTY